MAGTGTNRTVTLLPIPGALGTVTIALNATDLGAMPLTTTRSFTLNVVAAPVVQPMISDGTNHLMSWNAIPGTMYRVRWKASLDGPVWNDLAGDVAATNTIATKIVPGDGGGAQRFYRIFALP